MLYHFELNFLFRVVERWSFSSDSNLQVGGRTGKAAMCSTGKLGAGVLMRFMFYRKSVLQRLAKLPGKQKKAYVLFNSGLNLPRVLHF